MNRFLQVGLLLSIFPGFSAFSKGMLHPPSAALTEFAKAHWKVDLNRYKFGSSVDEYPELGEAKSWNDNEYSWRSLVKKPAQINFYYRKGYLYRIQVYLMGTNICNPAVASFLRFIGNETERSERMSRYYYIEPSVKITYTLNCNGRSNWMNDISIEPAVNLKDPLKGFG